MKLPRPRLTVRRLMIAVASIGVALGGLATLHRRREYALALADRHNDQTTAAIAENFAKPDVKRFNRLIDYHIAMGEKWQAAAARPWLRFRADPPPPE